MELLEPFGSASEDFLEALEVDLADVGRRYLRDNEDLWALLVRAEVLVEWHDTDPFWFS